MTRRSSCRQVTILMGDARGRFTRVRASLAEMAHPIRPRRRLPIICEQLALF